MYQTFRDVVLAVREKYEEVDVLSKGSSGECHYSHEYNGVGCAIGCLFDPEQAKLLGDITKHGETDVFGILQVPWKEALLHSVISPDIPTADLANLQITHDMSVDVSEFRIKLDIWLETGHWVEGAYA